MKYRDLHQYFSVPDSANHIYGGLTRFFAGPALVEMNSSQIQYMFAFFY